MDVAEYLPMFIAESREHLEGLGLAVVRIEERPDDRATIDEIFRIAHSFKGMSATMGYEAVAELTHAMEDVFELLRRRRDGLDRDAVDVLLACIDALDATVDRIEAGDGEGLDPAPLVARLRSLVREDAPAAALHVTVRLAEEAEMPAVRAFMVLGEAAEHGTLERSEPDAEALDGFAGDTIELWVRTDGPDGLLAALARVPDVAGARIATPEPEPEPAPAPAPPTKTTAASVRVPAARLDDLLHAMGELVVHRTHVEALVAGSGVPGLGQAMAELTRSAHALQELVMGVRMIPVEAVLLRLPRLVRDLASRLDKEVDLELIGQETELDRTVVDAIGDPLVHLVRNALDHGLEPPEERVAAGKPPRGRLTVAARQAGGGVVIDVRDDGRGVNPGRVARKAVERGLIASGEVDAAAAAELIFTPGFSTAEHMSDVSGRGVGMDAVRAKVRELGGDVRLTSVHGAGSHVEIRLPLTLAIVRALLVRSAGGTFAIPLDRVERTVRLDDHVVRSVRSRPVLLLDGRALPLICGAASLAGAGGSDGDYAVLLPTGADETIALRVDGLVGQRELVVRPLPEELVTDAPVSGAAVLSDGDIALIVDADGLGAR
jgi:two-component system, chemotaxis family, sensor kinase CheA